jgi:hypothetical protein
VRLRRPGGRPWGFRWRGESGRVSTPRERRYGLLRLSVAFCGLLWLSVAFCGLEPPSADLRPRPVPRFFIGLLTFSLLAMLVAMGAAALSETTPTWAVALAAVASGTVLAALIGLSLGPRSRDPRLVVTLGFVAIGIGGGLAVLTWAPPVTGPGTPLVGGLPIGAAWLVYGIGLAPLFIVPLVYAWTFEAETGGDRVAGGDGVAGADRVADGAAGADRLAGGVASGDAPARGAADRTTMDPGRDDDRDLAHDS